MHCPMISRNCQKNKSFFSVCKRTRVDESVDQEGRCWANHEGARNPQSEGRASTSWTPREPHRNSSHTY